MRKLFILLLIFTISGCATSGIINKTEFVDSIYPFSVKFPVDYELRLSGKNSSERVSAVRYRKETNIIHGLMLLKPVFVISVFDTTKSFDEFIKINEEKFFDPRYYFKYNVIQRKDIETNEHPTHLIFFTSAVATAGGEGISIKGNNLGITGFIHMVDYYIKIEYVANKSNFNQEDFDLVIKSISPKRSFN